MIKNEEIYRENISDLLEELTLDLRDVSQAYARLNRRLFKNNDNEMLRIDTNYFGEIVSENISHLQQIQDNLKMIGNELLMATEEGYATKDGYKEKYRW